MWGRSCIHVRFVLCQKIQSAWGARLAEVVPPKRTALSGAISMDTQWRADSQAERSATRSGRAHTCKGSDVPALQQRA